MKDKLILTDVREGSRKRGTYINVYDEAHEILKDLSTRSGQTMSGIANKMIRFAAKYTEVEGFEVKEE